MAADDDIITTAEVAEMIGMSPHWVLKKWRAGELPGFKFGTAVRYRRGDIRSWMEGQRRGPGAGERQVAGL